MTSAHPGPAPVHQVQRGKSDSPHQYHRANAEHVFVLVRELLFCGSVVVLLAVFTAGTGA